MKHKMRQIYPIIFLVLIIPFSVFAATTETEYDKIGGWKAVTAEPRLYFYVRHIDGIWWFINPAGNAFLSKGVSKITFTGDFCPALGYYPYWRMTMGKYKQTPSWAEAVLQNLKRWNLNTIGINSTPVLRDEAFPYTVVLDIANKTGGDLQHGIFPNVFEEDFKRNLKRLVKRECKPLRDSIYLLGYYSDMELVLGESWQNRISLLRGYLRMPQQSAGFQGAMKFLKQRYKTIDDLNTAWGLDLARFHDIQQHLQSVTIEQRRTDERDFLEYVSTRYFQLCHDAIQEADPNHLFFGCPLTGTSPEPVLNALRGFADVIGYRSDHQTPPRSELIRIFQVTNRPVMISEFSFKAMDSGLPNSVGRGSALETQSERAKAFHSYVSDLAAMPFVVGYHWRQYTDQPKQGTTTGENNNYGLVTVNDEPYELLTREMHTTNKTLDRIHAGLR